MCRDLVGMILSVNIAVLLVDKVCVNSGVGEGVVGNNLWYKNVTQNNDVIFDEVHWLGPLNTI